MGNPIFRSPSLTRKKQLATQHGTSYTHTTNSHQSSDTHTILSNGHPVREVISRDSWLPINVPAHPLELRDNLEEIIFEQRPRRNFSALFGNNSERDAMAMLESEMTGNGSTMEDIMLRLRSQLQQIDELELRNQRNLDLNQNQNMGARGTRERIDQMRIEDGTGDAAQMSLVNSSSVNNNFTRRQAQQRLSLANARILFEQNEQNRILSLMRHPATANSTRAINTIRDSRDRLEHERIIRRIRNDRSHDPALFQSAFQRWNIARTSSIISNNEITRRTAARRTESTSSDDVVTVESVIPRLQTARIPVFERDNRSTTRANRLQLQNNRSIGQERQR